MPASSKKRPQLQATKYVTQGNFTTHLFGEKVENFEPEQLLKETEVLREMLVFLYCKEGSFSSPAVLELSQLLDKYIVSVQKIEKHVRT
ncbi:aspartyl-phosphate phosphatase Spo0E family protein (plasmid) [Brevibacillus laterosporus]|uniref:Aspartyl-phosphate phosphatase Spo0E family protein n=1 Tax=Brevibacillus laterosporus TaxID=1465 RepID=A0A518V210_BRELA|nr:aspartyl-phosphate phosphatase Spo0E family protein [Brevibacillus laterosporus]